MHSRSYIGIESNNNNEWIVALLVDKETVFFRTFQNTSSDLIEMVRFICGRCPKPKICLKQTSLAVFRLVKLMGRIPNVEVILMSQAGMAMQQAWLRQSSEALSPQADQAFMLARCAERMI